MKKFLSCALVMITVLSLLLVLVSCGAKPNEDPDKVVAALEAAGYEDVYKTSKGFSYLGVSGIDWKVSGIIMEPKCEWIEVYYFESTTAANNAWEKMQEEAQSWFNNPSDYGSKFVCEKSGNMIWFGTENAVKAAK